MVEESEILQISPPRDLGPFFDGKPPKLWCLGEQRILNGRLLGIISSRQADADLAAKSAHLLQQLASLKAVAFIGGWHSPLEKEALRILSGNSAQIVFCIAKSLNHFTPPDELRTALQQRRALLLTHCTSRAKRISREASVRRNRVVAELSTALLVLSAPEGSETLKLALLTLHLGKPVFAIECPINHELLRAGATPARAREIAPHLAKSGL